MRLLSFTLDTVRTTSVRHITKARAEVVESFRAAAGEWTPWEGPVVLEVVDQHLTPESGWEGMQCNNKPDLVNVMKLVADALNGVAYRDDAQISKACLVKRYGDREERQVYLSFLDPKPKPLHGVKKVNDALWIVWDEGLRLGSIERIGTGRYDARFWDGYRYHGEIVSAGHRTLKQAEAAIRKAVARA